METLRSVASWKDDIMRLLRYRCPGREVIASRAVVNIGISGSEVRNTLLSPCEFIAIQTQTT